MSPAPAIRRAAVAGMFYPGDASALADTVDALLESAPAHPLHARMLLSPHAGYRYSGAVAARAFRCAVRGDVDTVIIIGPSHVEAFNFTSVFDGDAYETPLGTLRVNLEVASTLAADAPTIRRSSRGHAPPRGSIGEHGIEVILPFLQRALGDVTIVPVVMGAQTWRAGEELGRALSRTAKDPRTLVVASSDLSHFHSYDEAVRLDSVFCGLFERLDAHDLFDAVEQGHCEACGAGPVIASLLATGAPGSAVARVLARLNSGDVTDDRTRVVGYAAGAVAVVAS
jgi:MEMO1 family protein